MRVILVLPLVLVGMVQPAFAQQQPPASATHPLKVPGDADRGEALTKRWCASCHLPDSKGAVSDVAPSFHWIAGQVQRNPDFIRTFLTHPHAPMPPLELDRGQIEDLVTYFQALAKSQPTQP
jgi:mono/diheme cytochrome c family protein